MLASIGPRRRVAVATCGGGWSMAETTSAGLFSGFSSSTGILSCGPKVNLTGLKRSHPPTNPPPPLRRCAYLRVSLQRVCESVCVAVLQEPLLQVVVAELRPAGSSFLGRVSGVPQAGGVDHHHGS